MTLIERWSQSMMDNYGTPPLALVRGAGAVVTDETGKQYVDLLGGIAVNALGHGHPALVEAVTGQLQTLGHVSNFFATGPQDRLAERLLELLEGVRLVGIVTTHRHADHIQALAGVLKAHDVWNGAHPADADAIADQVGVTPDRVLEHGDVLTVGRHAVTVLHTPGHTEGSISFKLPSYQVLTGDALFPGGVGRTEGPEAFAEAIRSAERHLLSLPAQTRISPGHGDDTLVEREAPQLDEWKARGW